MDSPVSIGLHKPCSKALLFSVVLISIKVQRICQKARNSGGRIKRKGHSTLIAVAITSLILISHHCLCSVRRFMTSSFILSYHLQEWTDVHILKVRRDTPLLVRFSIRLPGDASSMLRFGRSATSLVTVTALQKTKHKNIGFLVLWIPRSSWAALVGSFAAPFSSCQLLAAPVQLMGGSWQLLGSSWAVKQARSRLNLASPSNILL